MFKIVTDRHTHVVIRMWVCVENDYIPTPGVVLILLLNSRLSDKLNSTISTTNEREHVATSHTPAHQIKW